MADDGGGSESRESGFPADTQWADTTTATGTGSCESSSLDETTLHTVPSCSKEPQRSEKVDALLRKLGERYPRAKKPKPKKKQQKHKILEIKRCPLTGQRLIKHEKRKNTNRPDNKTTKKHCHQSENSLYQEQEELEENEITIENEITVGNEVTIETEEVPVDTGEHSKATLSSFVTFLKSLIGPKKQKKERKRKTWFQRSENTIKEWENARPAIWKEMKIRETLDTKCNICCERGASIKCKDCIENALCSICDDIIHSSLPLHDRVVEGRRMLPLEVFDDEEGIMMTARYPKLKCNTCINCNGSNTIKRETNNTCVIITLKGRFDLCKYFLYCEDCHSSIDPFTVGTLLRSGYWPGNISSINYMFNENIFLLWDKFRKYMPGSSERAFLRSINAISEENGRKDVIDPVSFSFAFKEWNFWMHEKDTIQQKNWLECPACDTEQVSGHVDGNCKLYRYKLGKRKRESHYKDELFVRNDEVASFVKNTYGDLSKLNNGKSSKCGGNWTAAKNVVRKHGKLDETGLEVSTCRHVIAQKALNMFRGEIFGYPMYIIKEFMIPKRVKFCFADVMCKLWGFMVEKDPSIGGLITPALSVMHAKGHSLDCQVVWSGEWLNGTGKSTGEETEQFFSYLSRTGNTTKHQSPENREETITELTWHWNRMKILKMIPYLKNRFSKNEERLKQIGDQNQTEETIDKWKTDIQNDARGHRVLKKRKLSIAEISLLLKEKVQMGDHMPFINSLFFPSDVVNMSKLLPLLDFERRDQKQAFERICPNISKNALKLAYISLSKDIWKPIIEEEIEKLFIEKVVISSQIGQIADTSKRKHGIRRKLESVKKKLNLTIVNYLKVMNKETDKQLFEELEKGQFPWRNSLSESTAIQRRIMVEIYLKKAHLLEERMIIKDEMISTLAFFQKKIELLQDEIKTENEEVSNEEASQMFSNVHRHILEQKGSIMLKKESLQWYREQLEKGIKTFAPIVDPTSLALLLGGEETEEERNNDNEENDDDGWEEYDEQESDENDDESGEEEENESKSEMALDLFQND